MATEREIGDLVARFRLVVDEGGVKDATLALDRLEKKTSGQMGRAGQNAGSAFSGAFKGALVGQAIVSVLDSLVNAAVASTKAFLAAGAAGELTGDAAATYIELDNSLTEAGEAVQTLALAFGETLAPAITEVAQALTVLAENDGLRGGLEAAFAPITFLAKGLNLLSGEADSAAGATKRNAKAQKELAETSKALQKELSAQEKQFRSLVDAQIDELEAGLRVESAVLSRAEAQDALVAAQEKANSSSVRGAEFLDRERDALESVRDAQIAVTDAKFRATRAADDLAEAQEALNEAQFRFGPQSSEAGEAADTLAEAQQSLKEANDDVGQAADDVASNQRDYTQALADGIPTAQEAAAATRDVEKAKLAVKQADLELVGAQVGFSTAQSAANGITQTGIEKARELESSLRALGLFAGSPEFAAQLLGAANGIGAITGTATLSARDGGAGLRSADAAKASAATTGNILQTNNFNGITDYRALSEQVNRELDWAGKANRANRERV